MVGYNLLCGRSRRWWRSQLQQDSFSWRSAFPRYLRLHLQHQRTFRIQRASIAQDGDRKRLRAAHRLHHAPISIPSHWDHHSRSRQTSNRTTTQRAPIRTSHAHTPRLVPSNQGLQLRCACHRMGESVSSSVSTPARESVTRGPRVSTRLSSTPNAISATQTPPPCCRAPRKMPSRTV